MRAWLTLAAFGLGTSLGTCWGAGGAAAGEVEDQVGVALEYYQEGDLDGAVTELQFAINAIRAELGEAYAKTFPEPPPGWTAEAVEQGEGAAFLGGGTMLGRAYRQEGGDASIDVQMTLDNPMMQGMAAMFGNPALLAAQPSMKRVRVGRDNAVLNTESNELTFMLGSRGMIQMTGSNLDDADVLVDLLKAWDFDALKDAAGL